MAVVNRVRVGLLVEEDTASEEDLLASLQELLTTEYITICSNEEEPPEIRWEPLAVALLVSTELLQQTSSSEEAATTSSVHGRSTCVPVMDATNDLKVPRLSAQAAVVLCPKMVAQ